MRLGLRPTVFQSNSEWSRMRKLYGGAGNVWERHRHRYEVNPAYVERFEASGMAFIGRDEKGERMQVMELPSTSHTCRSGPYCVSTRTFFWQNTPSSSACNRTPSSVLVRSIRRRRSLASSQPHADPMSLNSRWNSSFSLSSLLIQRKQWSASNCSFKVYENNC